MGVLNGVAVGVKRTEREDEDEVLDTASVGGAEVGTGRGGVAVVTLAGDSDAGLLVSLVPGAAPNLRRRMRRSSSAVGCTTTGDDEAASSG